MQETWVRSLGQEDPLKKEWHPSPVLMPGKSHGQRSLVGYSPQGREESDTTERLHLLTLTYLHLLHFYTSWSIKDDLPSYPRQLKPWTKYMKQWISDVDQQAVQDSRPE